MNILINHNINNAGKIKLQFLIFRKKILYEFRIIQQY